jgi:hypothetical protein
MSRILASTIRFDGGRGSMWQSMLRWMRQEDDDRGPVTLATVVAASQNYVDFLDFPALLAAKGLLAANVQQYELLGAGIALVTDVQALQLQLATAGTLREDAAYQWNYQYLNNTAVGTIGVQTSQIAINVFDTAGNQDSGREAQSCQIVIPAPVSNARFNMLKVEAQGLNSSGDGIGLAGIGFYFGGTLGPVTGVRLLTHTTVTSGTLGGGILEGRFTLRAVLVAA